MRTSAAPAWADGDLTLGPGAPPRKRFQRIFPSGWSEWLKESRTGDADDGTLIWRTRQGDAAAFEALIRQHQHMIYSLTYRMTGSAADAEDLTQETFLRAWRQIGSYRAAAKFSTWLYRIAINACLTWRQRETLRLQVQAGWAETNGAPELAGETTLARNETGRSVHAALLKLPAKQRAAIMLTLYDGLSHAEAAEVLGCSETTVSWRVFAARRKLRRWLAAAGEGGGP
ncbi:MAG: RNA polymerase sigma factor [Verrucomicrobiota bacterium]